MESRLVVIAIFSLKMNGVAAFEFLFYAESWLSCVSDCIETN